MQTVDTYRAQDSWSDLVGIGLIFLLAFYFGYKGWSFSRIAERQQKVFATVTEHHPEDHNSYCYKFKSNEENYTGCDSQWDEKNEPQIGKPVTIYYDPLNPSENSFKDFHSNADQSVAPTIVTLSIWIGLSIQKVRRLRRKKSPTGAA